MRAIFIAQLMIIFIFGGAWIWNINKLTDCDFEPDFKCEAVHAIGIIPPAAIVTVWFGVDE